MRRIAQVIGIAPEHIEEYERLHASVWPEVLLQIEASNIHNYSIYRFGTTLFAYFEYTGHDLEGDLASMAADPATQRWWSVCAPMQRPLPDRGKGAWWMTVPEVFHVD